MEVALVVVVNEEVLCVARRKTKSTTRSLKSGFSENGPAVHCSYAISRQVLPIMREHIEYVYEATLGLEH